MKDLKEFLEERKQENLKRLPRHEERERNLKRSIMANESMPYQIPGYPYAVTPDRSGREQLVNCIAKQNALIAEIDLIEEIQTKYSEMLTEK